MVYIILGSGFEEIEAVAVYDILRRGGVEVVFASVGPDRLVSSARGMTVKAEKLINDISPGKGDYIVIPGGMGGVETIKSSSEAQALIKASAVRGAGMAAICAGPSVLASLGLLDGKSITCYPGCEEMMTGAACDISRPTTVDGSLVTGRAPGAALDFGLELLASIAGEKKAEEVRRGLVY